MIVFTDAPAKARYSRSIARARDNEKLNTFEEFLEREAKENGAVNSNFNLLGIKQKADVVLDNDDALDTFLMEAVVAIGLIKSKK